MLIEFLALTDIGEITVEASIVGRGRPHAIIMSVRSGGKMLDLPIEKERELATLALEEAGKVEYFQLAMQKDSKPQSNNQEEKQ